MYDVQTYSEFVLIDAAAPIMTAIIMSNLEVLRLINYVHSYHELQPTDALWEDGIEAYSHNNKRPNFGWNFVVHVTVKCLAGLPRLTISRSHRVLEHYAARAENIP
jgi:hypothetical protein